MPLPSSLRYLKAKLQPLRQPVFWCSTLALVLTAVFLWEYRNHPEWSGQFAPAEGDASNTDQASGLTAEERSSIADIDSLAVLFSDFESSNPSTAGEAVASAPSQEATGTSLDQLMSSLNTSPPGLTEEATGLQAGGLYVSPFDVYLENYRFPVHGNQGQAGSNAPAPATPPRGTTASNSLGLGTAGYGVPLGGISPPPPLPSEIPSSLQQALDQQLQQPPIPSANEAETSTDSPAIATAAETGSTPDPATAINPYTGAPSGVVEGSIPGLPYTFLQTTPQMSPPAGTTGYTPPTSVYPASPSNYYNPVVPPRTGTVPSGVVPPAATGGSLQLTPIRPSTSGVVAPQTPGTTYTQPASTPSPFFAPSDTSPDSREPCREIACYD